MPAAAGGNWATQFEGLDAQAQVHLQCILAHPSHEGPESCGLNGHPEVCADAACLSRHLEGWRGLIGAFGKAAPADLERRLEAIPGLPRYVLAAPIEDPEETLAELDKYCPDAVVDEDMLETCVFDAANAASAWVDIFQWLDGVDPRQRAGG
jgi:hypothetical protein